MFDDLATDGGRASRRAVPLLAPVKFVISSHPPEIHHEHANGCPLLWVVRSSLRLQAHDNVKG